MKTRNGFISNSSSTSFICDVCSHMESGMDASARDLGFETCVNGHVFCDSHVENLPKQTPADIRKDIKEQITSDKYWDETTKKSALDELDDTLDDDIEELFEESYSDDGVAACQCPICTFTELSTDDGFAFLKKNSGFANKEILDAIKSTFKTYKEFEAAIKPKKA